MLRLSLAVMSLGATVAIFSCSDARLGGGTNDAGGHDAAGGCRGTMLPSWCYRACDGSSLTPQAETCPTGYSYIPASCALGSIDGQGPVPPVPNTCSDGGIDARGGTGGTACPLGTGGQGGAGSGASCTDLVNDAPPVVSRSHTGDRPADAVGVGGVIVDGVYDLVGRDLYRSANDGQYTSVGTIRISNGGTRMEDVNSHNYGGGSCAVYHTVRMLAAAGTLVTNTQVCPNSGSGTDEYTATPTTLMFSNPLWVFRYSRR